METMTTSFATRPSKTTGEFIFYTKPPLEKCPRKAKELHTSISLLDGLGTKASTGNTPRMAEPIKATQTIPLSGLPSSAPTWQSDDARQDDDPYIPQPRWQAQVLRRMANNAGGAPPTGGLLPPQGRSPLSMISLTDTTTLESMTEMPWIKNLPRASGGTDLPFELSTSDVFDTTLRRTTTYDVGRTSLSNLSSVGGSLVEPYRVHNDTYLMADRPVAAEDDSSIADGFIIDGRNTLSIGSPESRTSGGCALPDAENPVPQEDYQDSRTAHENLPSSRINDDAITPRPISLERGLWQGALADDDFVNAFRLPALQSTNDKLRPPSNEMSDIAQDVETEWSRALRSSEEEVYRNSGTADSGIMASQAGGPRSCPASPRDYPNPLIHFPIEEEENGEHCSGEIVSSSSDDDDEPPFVPRRRRARYLSNGIARGRIPKLAASSEPAEGVRSDTLQSINEHAGTLFVRCGLDRESNIGTSGKQRPAKCASTKLKNNRASKRKSRNLSTSLSSPGDVEKRNKTSKRVWTHQSTGPRSKRWHTSEPDANGEYSNDSHLSSATSSTIVHHAKRQKTLQSPCPRACQPPSDEASQDPVSVEQIGSMVSPAYAPSDEPTWAIDRIVGSMLQGEQMLYRIRWRDTWEPAESLEGCADTAIEEFASRTNRQRQKGKRKRGL